MKDPKLYLAVDNCFACKRWVRPADWMRLIRDMGLSLVEQSADTECDPLYMGADYMREWIDLVKKESEKTGVYVKNVYSGHGTYSTCGMAHWHDGVRLRFREQWMKPQADTACAIGAGFGFFAHGFEHSFLQSKAVYEDRLNILYDDLAELAAYAKQIDLSYIGLEQMYTPHMPPWTISGTIHLLQEVLARAGAPMYITLDIGHMNGQQYFLKPALEQIEDMIQDARAGVTVSRPWLGSECANAMFDAAIDDNTDAKGVALKIARDVEKNPHLFAKERDGVIWNWVERLGQYAPIVHLQQTDGKSSPHWPFSQKYNEMGVASGEKLMESLFRSFEQPAAPCMPEPVDEIVLTLEPFVGTAANPYRAVEEIAESIAYWRRFVPHDGMRLSEAKDLLGQNVSA